MNAAMFLEATESGVIQRHAARFLLLVLFSWALRTQEFVREGYRLTILRVCGPASSPLSNLEAILRAEMARFHPELPRLICDQGPLTDEERSQGLRILDAHYTRNPCEFMMDAPRVGHEVVDPTQSSVIRFVKGLIVQCRSVWLLVSGAGTRRRRRETGMYSRERFSVGRKGKILLAVTAVAAMYVAHAAELPEGAVVFLGVIAVGLSLHALSGVGSPKPTLCAGGCGRHIRVLAYGRAGGVTVSRDEMTSGVGAAELCRECGRIFCDIVLCEAAPEQLSTASGGTKCITNEVPCIEGRCIS